MKPARRRHMKPARRRRPSSPPTTLALRRARIQASREGAARGRRARAGVARNLVVELVQPDLPSPRPSAACPPRAHECARQAANIVRKTDDSAPRQAAGRRGTAGNSGAPRAELGSTSSGSSSFVAVPCAARPGLSTRHVACGRGGGARVHRVHCAHLELARDVHAHEASLHVERHGHDVARLHGAVLAPPRAPVLPVLLKRRMHLPPRRAARARDDGAAPRGGARALRVMAKRALWRPREQAHAGAAKTATAAAKVGGSAAQNAPRCRGGRTPSRAPAVVCWGGGLL